VEAGYIKHKMKRRDWRTLKGANSDWAENLRGTLAHESALAFGEERFDPGNQIGGDPSFGEGTSQLICADSFKTTFDIQEAS